MGEGDGNAESVDLQLEQDGWLFQLHKSRWSPQHQQGGGEGGEDGGGDGKGGEEGGEPTFLSNQRDRRVCSKKEGGA